MKIRATFDKIDDNGVVTNQGTLEKVYEQGKDMDFNVEVVHATPTGPPIIRPAQAPKY